MLPTIFEEDELQSVDAMGDAPDRAASAMGDESDRTASAPSTTEQAAESAGQSAVSGEDSDASSVDTVVPVGQSSEGFWTWESTSTSSWRPSFVPALRFHDISRYALRVNGV